MADNGLVGVGVHRHVFGGKALHSISGSRAAVDKKRHIESLAVDGAEVATPAPRLTMDGLLDRTSDPRATRIVRVPRFPAQDSHHMTGLCYARRSIRLITQLHHPFGQCPIASWLKLGVRGKPKAAGLPSGPQVLPRTYRGIRSRLQPGKGRGRYG
jgi:hypothetical protein